MTSSSFKSLAAAIVLGGAALLSTGCASKSGLDYDFFAPPAYSSSENFQRQLRNGTYDWSQAIDDFDKDVVMSRPASELTKWHVRSTD